MSTLTSASTIAEIKASYIDNASYAEDADVAKARAFITACRILLLKMPAVATKNGESVQMRPEVIRQEMEAAQEWVEATDANEIGPRVVKGSFQNFRW
jgi:electron transfer flavoprotein alpha/beta subunit